MKFDFDLSAVFGNQTKKPAIARKPAVPATSEVGDIGFKFDFSAGTKPVTGATRTHRVRGQQSQPQKSSQPKMARETFWDKYTKTKLDELREVYGVEDVNHAMMFMTLEAMEQKFGM